MFLSSWWWTIYTTFQILDFISSFDEKMNHSHRKILVQCQCVITIISIFKYSSIATLSGVTCQITTVFTYHSTCRFLKYSAEHFSVATRRALIWVYTNGKRWEELSETCARSMKKKIKVSLGKLWRLLPIATIHMKINLHFISSFRLSWRTVISCINQPTEGSVITWLT